MAKPHKAGAAREIGRMEAFSDGVFGSLMARVLGLAAGWKSRRAL